MAIAKKKCKHGYACGKDCEDCPNCVKEKDDKKEKV